MILAMIHFVLALAMAVSAVAAFFRWQQDKFDKQSPVGYFFWFFALFSASHFLMSSPFIFSANPLVMKWGFILSLVGVFCMFAICAEMIFYFYGFPMKLAKYFSLAILLVGLFVLVLQIKNDAMPAVNQAGFIVWNMAPLAATVIVFFAFLSSFSLVYILIHNLLDDASVRAKLKLLLVSFSLICIGISATYFIADRWSVIIFALSFNLVGAIAATSAFLIDKGAVKEDPAKA